MRGKNRNKFANAEKTMNEKIGITLRKFRNCRPAKPIKRNESPKKSE